MYNWPPKKIIKPTPNTVEPTAHVTLNPISVIIPVKEEMALQFHRKIIESYKPFPNCELLWVIGPNNDGTLDDLVDLNQHVIQSKANSRAERINEGINASSHPLILLNHPRSFLSADAIQQLSQLDVDNRKVWGGFTHRFYQTKHWALKFTSFYSNVIRFGLFGIVYLDHCIFLSRNTLQAEDSAPVPRVDIFEDTLFSQKLNRVVKPIRIREHSNTSPIRFITNGIFKQSLMNQKLKLQHSFGASNIKMNKQYEKNLNLNSEY